MITSKALSLAMIRIEIDNAKESSESIKQMLKTVEQAIEEDKISYDEFIDILTEYFKELAPDTDNSSEEERSNTVEAICNKIIDKYGSEEK